MMAYQLWNLVVCCLFIKEYRTVNFIVHHFTTMLVSSLVSHPYANYYALFYLGIAETSSIPLTVNQFHVLTVANANDPTLSLKVRSKARMIVAQ